jgi:hypothetical protein
MCSPKFHDFREDVMKGSELSRFVDESSLTGFAVCAAKFLDEECRSPRSPTPHDGREMLYGRTLPPVNEFGLRLDDYVDSRES